MVLATFSELLIAFLKRVNLLYLLYSTTLRRCLLHLLKQNCLLINFLRTLILMAQACVYLISLLELIWNCIFLTSKLVKKVITKLNLSKASGPDYIALVVLKNYEPELSYLLNSSICVKRNLVFQIVARSHPWSLYLRMLGWGLQLKTTALLVFFLWLVVFETFVNNRLVDHSKKCGLFCDFQQGFRSSQSTANLLCYLLEFLGLLTGLGLLNCAEFDVSKAFIRV